LVNFSAKRLNDGPIVHPGLSSSIGENIQGPSLIQAPEWLPNRLDQYIRLVFADRLTGPWTIYEPGPTLFPSTMRHSAVLKQDQTLHLFWTNVGDAPKRILHSTVDLSPNWLEWIASAPKEVLRPETEWEGAGALVEPSMRSVAYGQVNQLRDPAIYVEGEDIYLLYATAGESGLAIAQLFQSS
jgi:hypothetical protein